MADKMVKILMTCFWNGKEYVRGQKVPASIIKGCPHVDDPIATGAKKPEPKKRSGKTEDVV